MAKRRRFVSHDIPREHFKELFGSDGNLTYERYYTVGLEKVKHYLSPKGWNMLLESLKDLEVPEGWGLKSVEDRLPTISGQYVGYSRKTEMYFIVHFDADKKLWTNNPLTHLDKVTHWDYLPKPRKD